MSTMSKFTLSAICAFVLGLGFSVSAFADDPCTECWLACDQRYQSCIQSGRTEAQCRETVNTCKVNCNCEVP